MFRIERLKKVKNMAKTYRAVEMGNGSGRFVIVDNETNKVLSDAAGYGFKSKTTACRSYAYYLAHVAQA